MTVKLTKPYKIVSDRMRRYESHYEIPAEKSLIVPVKVFGDEVSCDIRWEDASGEAHLLQGKLFVPDNLVALNPLFDFELYEIWSRHYKV
jgi:hypothetical protein